MESDLGFSEVWLYGKSYQLIVIELALPLETEVRNAS